VWLTDFGICLIRDLDRSTEVSEVVGPTQFIAPELEGGGQLKVSPAADIYSLGKVIYFMLSGGVVLPREELYEPQYQKIFESGGERQRLFQILLSKMVCPLKNRLTSMGDVLSEITRIEKWADDARIISISKTSLAGIELLQKRVLESKRKEEEHITLRKKREQGIELARNGSLAWLREELKKLASTFGQGGGILTGVRGSDESNNPAAINNYRPSSGVELWVTTDQDSSNRQHILRFSFCTKFTLSYGPTVEHEFSEVAILPTYGHTYFDNSRRHPVNWNMLTTDNKLYVEPKQSPGVSPIRSLYPNFPTGQARPATVQLLTFSTDQWPSAADFLPGTVERAMETFIIALNSESSLRF
jgi:serine/threonine protein kinase